MIHEWWGLNSSICQTATIFSNKKFGVFVPDLYRSQPAKDAENAGHKMSGLDWKGALEDIKHVKEHFEKLGKGVYVMGFCMGGALTIASICSIPGWKAASPFYGIPDLKAFNLANIKCPTLAHFGEEDVLQGFSCSKSAKGLKEEADKVKAPVDVKIWPNANHAFCNQDSRYFNAGVRDSAFKLTQELFEKN
jgi:carboxymethylenebutenolidase